MVHKTHFIKTIFIAALAMSAYQPAHALDVCRAAAYTCAGTATGGLLVCAAASYEVGANPIADVACGDLYAGARASCATMPISCRYRPGTLQGVIPLSNVGATSGPVNESKACPGSHRVSGLEIWVQNSRVRKINFKCTDGTGLNTGPQLGTKYTGACSAGSLAAGANVRTSGGLISAFQLRCDNVVAASTASDVLVNVGPTGNGSLLRACAEGQYLAGYSAVHGGSTSYLTGISLLCRALPK